MARILQVRADNFAPHVYHAMFMCFGGKSEHVERALSLMSELTFVEAL